MRKIQLNADWEHLIWNSQSSQSKINSKRFNFNDQNHFIWIDSKVNNVNKDSKFHICEEILWECLHYLKRLLIAKWITVATGTNKRKTPFLYWWKRLSKNDIGHTDMWRIFMRLQSELLSENTRALDVLNILLFDDSLVQWFSLD